MTPNEADARLIAAAPELLDALKEMESMYTHAFDAADGGLFLHSQSVKRFDAACELAHAAIAKATGSREGAAAE